MAQFGNITNSGKARISSKYGPRNIGGRASRNHKGIDIAYPSGTQITSPLDGVIEKANPKAGNCGGLIVINHGTFNGKNVKSKYCHVKRIDVEKGKEVKKGQVVGLSGGGSNDPGRGNSMGAHIHFEILEDGKNVNPEPYYTGAPSGQQTQLPSEFDSAPDKNNSDSNLDIDDEDDSKGTLNKSREQFSNLIKKLFGVGQESNVNPDVVNEILRYKEIIEEATPTITNQSNKCAPYSEDQLPIKPCTERQDKGNGEIRFKGGPNIISQDQGPISQINKGQFSVGIKIGNTEYFWRGELTNKNQNVQKGDILGTTSDNQLVIRNSSKQNQTNQTQMSGSTASNSFSKDYLNVARQNFTGGLVQQLMQGQTAAPTTQKESIEKLKPLIINDIKLFNKLIK